MSEVNKGVETPEPEKVGGEEPKATVFVEQEGTAKKILKWVIRGIVVLASGALGFFAGRASVGTDEEEAEATEEKTEE